MSNAPLPSWVTDGRKGVREAQLADGRWIQISERRTAVAAIRLAPLARRVAKSTATPVSRFSSSSRRLA